MIEPTPALRGGRTRGLGREKRVVRCAQDGQQEKQIRPAKTLAAGPEEATQHLAALVRQQAGEDLYTVIELRVIHDREH